MMTSQGGVGPSLASQGFLTGVDNNFNQAPIWSVS